MYLWFLSASQFFILAWVCLFFFLGAHQAAEEWCRFWPVICSPHPGEILKHPLPEVIFVNSLEEHNKGKRNQETQIKGNQKVNDSF